MQLANNGLPPSDEALRDCRRFLISSLELGWTPKQLVQLEEMWWRWHDSEGNLTNEVAPEVAIPKPSKRA